MIVIFLLATLFFGYWALMFTFIFLIGLAQGAISSALLVLLFALAAWLPTVFFGRKVYKRWRKRHPAPTEEEKAQRREERRIRAEEKQAQREEKLRQKQEAEREAAQLKAQQEFESNVAMLTEYVYCSEEQMAKYFINGELPTEYRLTSLLLKEGETVKYYGTAIQHITKNKAIGRTGGYGGASIRIAKGVTLRTGSSAGHTIYGDVTDSYSGEIVITNQRIVFINEQKGFEVALKSVTAITPMDEEIVIQAKTKAYRLFVTLPELVLACVNQTV